MEYLQNSLNKNQATEIESITAHDEATQTRSSQETVSAPVNDITSVLMDIVSEKTGYPQQMLEPEMDMESDLGIDSIKRVEIMWSLQESFQDLPQIGANDVAELRTVGQIIDYIKSVLPDNTKGTSSSKPMILGEDEKPTSNEDRGSGGNGDGSTKEVSVQVTGEIAPALLRIIGEKTGYPPEMLDLNMDMEADLGIDSIKRVEIMWSLQEQLPTYPRSAEVK